MIWELAQSPVLWGRRLAILSTFAFIRTGDLDDALKLYAQLLTDRHAFLQGDFSGTGVR